MTAPGDVPQGFEAWLDDLLGMGHGRRVAALGADRILLTKVDPGLPARVLDAVDRLPALSDAAVLRALMPADLPPIPAWQWAVSAVLADAGRAGLIGPAVEAEVCAGVESLAALLDACCWTADGPDWRPTEAEKAALREAGDRLAQGSGGLFTRHYGIFGGRRVENHCPGAGVARRMFWAAVSAILGEEQGAELARELPPSYDGQSFGPVV